MVRQHKSWDDILLEEREENSRLRQQQRDQAERERRLAERLTQLKEQQSALQQGKTVDAVGRDGKIKGLQVCTCAQCPPPGGLAPQLRSNAPRARVPVPRWRNEGRGVGPGVRAAAVGAGSGAASACRCCLWRCC